jgi:HEAT repeat protein
MPILIRLSREGDTAMCGRAVRALAEFGPKARPALPRLIELLKSAPQTRVDPETALGAIGPEAVEPLLAVSKAAPTDTLRRRRVLSALVLMGPRAAPHVVEFLRDQGNRTQAELALRSWCRDAERSNETVRFVIAVMPADRKLEPSALTILAETGPRAAPAVEPLIEILKRPDSPTDWGFSSHPPRLGCQILGGIGPAAKAAVPELVGRLEEKEPSIRAAAAAVTRIDPDNKPAIAALAALVNEKMGSRALVAAYRRFGPPPPPLVPALKDALRSDEPIPRGSAALMLAETGVEAERIVEVLTELLRKSERGVPTEILDALALIGPRAKPAVPVLLERLDTCGPYDAPLYIEALAAIVPDDPRLIPFLVQAVRRTAAAPAAQPRTP